MMTGRFVRAAALAAALLVCAAGSGRADECDDMMKAAQTLIDKEEKPADNASSAFKCARYAKLLGLIKAYRVVVDECWPEDKRVVKLAEGDRISRELQFETDKMCRAGGKP